MLKWILLTAVIATSHESILFAKENDGSRPLTKSEAQLSELCVEMFAEYEKYYDGADVIKDEAEKEKYFKEQDPSPKYVEKLLEFERTHHQTHAGLMAARRLVLLGAGGGEANNPRDLGRRHALIALRDYRNADELFEILRYTDSGNHEPEAETLLRYLINASDVNKQNKVLAKIAFARWSFTMRRARNYGERRLKELARGDELRFPNEQEYFQKRLEVLPVEEKITQLEREATEFLEEIAASNSTLKQPGVANLDEHWHVIRVDQKKTEPMPLVKDLAIGMLFHEQHLQIGKPAPDLKIPLVTGEDWSLSDQRGKTVIIQFSFKGCGPCEEMYSTLGSLMDAYKEKLVVLSIMADEKRVDTLNAVESGKLKWKVCWDGSRGPVTTKWAVTSFPTIYVIGPDGQIADIDLRDKRLSAKIAELTH